MLLIVQLQLQLMVTFNKNLLILKTKIMETKKFILRVCLVLVLLISPLQTKMLALPVGTCEITSLKLVVPDDGNCNKYYLCILGVGGIFLHLECAPGYKFDVDELVCRLDADANNPYPCY
jgi:hypothetical protein